MNLTPLHSLISSVTTLSIAYGLIDATLVDSFTVPSSSSSLANTSAIISSSSILQHPVKLCNNKNHLKYRHNNIRQILQSSMTLNSSNKNDSNDVTTTQIINNNTNNNELFETITTLTGKTASTLVSLTFFLLLSTRRDALITTLFIGSIANAVSGKILKRVINQERPELLELSSQVKLKPSDGGMPSSHAMSLSFIGVVLFFGIVLPSTTAAGMNISNIGSTVIQYTIGTLILLYSTIALRYRVRDHLHTLDQIVVGYSIGLINAFLWLKYAVSINYDGNTEAVVGPVMGIVQRYLISSETNQFPMVGLLVPMLVGVVVVGSFERRIGLWMKNKREKGVEDNGYDDGNHEKLE